MSYLRIKVITFSGIVFIAVNALGTEWVNFPGGVVEGAPPTLNVVTSDGEHTVIEIFTPGMWVEEVNVEDEIFHKLTLPEYANISALEAGRPETPAIAKFVGVPGNKQVTFNILEMQTTILTDYWVYPLQPDFTREEGRPPFTIDREFYEGWGAFYPENLLDVNNPGIWRDLRVVCFNFTPVRFKPTTSELEVTYYCKFELAYGGEDDENVKEDPNYPIETTYADMYRAAVLNYDNLDLAEVRWDFGPGKYLIITAPPYEGHLSPLVNWLKKRGFTVDLRRTDEIPGGNNFPGIHAFIKKHYEGFNTKYVLLVGLHTELPAGMRDAASSKIGKILSDYCYSCVAGSDIYPELAVGRLAENFLTAFDKEIEKIIRYGESPPLGEWPANVLLVASKIDWVKLLEFESTKEYIRCYPDYNVQPNFFECYGDDGAINEDIVGNINAGRGVVNYTGHGGVNNWWNWSYIGENFTWDPYEYEVTPNDKYPIVFNYCCLNGKLDEPICHVRTWLRPGPSYPGYSGAVAALGASRKSWYNANSQQDVFTFRSIYQIGIKTIGDVSNYAKIWLFEGYGGKYATDNILMYLIIGEPSTGVKTKAIGTLNVSHPASLPSGAAYCEVSVTDAASLESVQDAVVCFYRDGVLHLADATAADGTVSFEFADTGDPGAGVITLTVYERNYVTYQADIDVE